MDPADWAGLVIEGLEHAVLRLAVGPIENCRRERPAGRS